MKNLSLFLLYFILLGNTCFGNTKYVSEETILKDIEKLLVKTSREYKSTLLSAMGSNKNLEYAIDFCKSEAIKISINNSDKNISIKRTSLKVRNLKNLPNDYESKILMKFQLLNADTQNSDIKLIHKEIINKNKKKILIYMKAIHIKEVCLNCHGKNIDKGLMVDIKKKYPMDKAVGYNLGDVRGAFVIEYVFNN